MSVPHWPSYVGMITGITGVVIACMSYRKVNSIKVSDRRLELRKSINDFHSTLAQTKELLPAANQSRENAMSATGMFRSGAMMLWKQQYNKDLNELKTLTDNAPAAGNYDGLSSTELESKLVDVHNLQLQLTALRNKYKEHLKHDDKQRKHIQGINERAR